MSRLARAGGAALVVAAAAAAGSPGAGQERAQIAVREGVARNVYITAVHGNGAPASDLAASEITVREDGKARQVLAVGPPTDLMQIVLLVDDSGPGIQHIRAGVAAFVRILRNDAEMALVTTGAQNAVLVDFTTDFAALMGGVNRLVPRTTSGGYLLDAIQESARTLQRREAPRPVIVVLAIEGTEYSNVAANRVLETVRESRALVHVLAVGKPSLKTMTPFNQRPTQSIHDSLDETISRSTVIVEAPRRSGGRLEQVVEPSGIPARFSEIARELRDQLLVTYARPPSAKATGKLEISTTRRGIKVRAPKQVF